MKPIYLGKSAAGDVMLDVAKLLDTRAFIQANSGGGKSYLLRKIAEQTIGQVQTIILDPEGEFATLREKRDLVLVGREGEIPCDVRAAGLLARKFAELQVSAVIDLYDLPISERRRYVRLFLESLIAIPKELYHPMIIILDEAHMFCPERSAGEAESTHAVINLQSLGRKRGMCGILATQRLSKLHKDAEAECNNVFIGRTVQDVDLKRAADVLGIAAAEKNSLRDLHWEFLGFGPAVSGDGVVKFKTATVETTHPKAGERHKLTAPKASDAVKQLVAGLADLPKQAEEEARTIEEAKRQIIDLQRQLKARPKETVEKPVIRIIEKPIFKAGEVERFEKGCETLRLLSVAVCGTAAEVRDTVREAVRRFQGTTPTPTAPAVIQRTTGAASQGEPRTPSSPPPPFSGSGRMPEGEEKILIAVAGFTEGLERDRIGVFTGYKRSTRNEYLKRLIARGFISSAGDRVTATQEGIDALGSAYTPLPTGVELQNYWRHRLPVGECKLLDILIPHHPTFIDRDALDEKSGFARSSRNEYLKRLIARGLVETSGKQVRASENLF